MAGIGGKQPAVGLGPRACVMCGTEFQPYRNNQVTCSRSCRDRQPHRAAVGAAWNARPENRERKNAARRISATDDPEAQERIRLRNLRVNLRSNYNLTFEQFQQMLAAQSGVCALCGSPPKPDGIKAASRLHVDHDHETGLVRELLCLNCNRGLGYFKDNPELMRAAADYVDRHRKRE